MSLIRKQAPDFSAPAWYNNDFVNISLDDFIGKYVVLFFYPLDFTFVCPTEIIAFDNMRIEFEKNGAMLLACSVDSKFAHMEYCLKERKDGGLGKMSIPLLSDLNKTIARSYGCLNEEDGVAYRATYIIDRKGIIRHCSINDLSVGRNPEETLRILKGFNYTDSHPEEVCPAKWNNGEKTMITDTKKDNYKEVINQAK